MCIVAGILVALRVSANRWRTVGGREGDLWDVSGWAIVFGIIGGRLYHVISDPELYFKHAVARHLLGSSDLASLIS